MTDNCFPDKRAVKHLRELYPKGSRVELMAMDDPYAKLMPGAQGTVSLVDDAGTVFVDWDSGPTLGIVYNVDKIRKL